MKKYFNKDFFITKEGNGDFENSSKYLICDNDYVDNNVKVRNHCHITEKYRGFRACNTNLKLNRILQPKKI